MALRQNVADHCPETLEDVVKRAYIAESVLDAKYGEYTKKNKAKQPPKAEANVEKKVFVLKNGNKNQKKNNNNGGYANKRKRDENLPAKPKAACPFCQKMHVGECLLKAGKCFGCGEQGHMIKDCPKEKG